MPWKSSSYKKFKQNKICWIKHPADRDRIELQASW